MNAGRQSSHSAQPFPSPPSTSDTYTTFDQEELFPTSLGTRAPKTSTPDFALQRETIARSITSNQHPQSPKPIDSTHTVHGEEFYDPFLDIGSLSNNGLDIDWGQPQLPSDIQDIFSGFFT